MIEGVLHPTQTLNIGLEATTVIYTSVNVTTSSPTPEDPTTPEEPTTPPADNPTTPDEPSTPATTYVSMYRIYNPNSGEHFYTASANERDNLKKLGWRDEGIAWYGGK